MRRIVKLSLWLALASLGFGQTTPTRIRTVTNLPGTCQPGDGVRPADMVGLVANGFTTSYVCAQTNIWITQVQFSGINTIPYFSAAGYTVVGDSHLTTDGAGHFGAVTASFSGGSTAGFVGLTQGTAPSLSVSNTTYLYSASSVPTSYGISLPSSPGTVGQALVIGTADATHNNATWGASRIIQDGGAFETTDSADFGAVNKLLIYTGTLGGFGRIEQYNSSNIRTADIALGNTPLGGFANSTGFVSIGDFNTPLVMAQSTATLGGTGSGLIFPGAVSGNAQIVVDDVAGTPVLNLPTTSGRFSVAKIEDCGTTTACANTVLTNPIIVKGTVALSSGTPSTATLTGLPFTSTSSYVCTATDQTAASALKIANASASSTVITGPNTVTDTIGYQCTGS